MKTIWLQQDNKADCLLFFSGWGMDAAPFRFLAAKHCDVLLIHDYRQLPTHFDLSSLLANYTRLHLIGWSMGVWVAAHVLTGQAKRFSTRLALAGTLRPIDDKQGIPQENYASLCQNLNPAALSSFYSAMFDGNEQELRHFLLHCPQQGLPDLQEELLAFQQAYRSFGPAQDIFEHKIITSRDRIFSARNQMRHWGRDNSLLRNWPHFPFFFFHDWIELFAHEEEKNTQQKREQKTDLLTGGI